MTTTSTTAPAPSAPGPASLVGGSSPVPLAYHRLAHLDPRTARWWRPLATFGAGSVLLLVPALVLLVVAVVVVVVVVDDLAPGSLPTWPSGLRPSPDLDDPRNPVDHLLGLGAIALLLPLVVLALRWGGGQRGLVHSVAGRFRWRLALRAGAVVLPVHAVVLAALVLLVPADDLSVPPLDLSLAAVVGVVLVMTPLQCAAEEYAFRGLPQQLLGTWLRRPVWGVVLPVPLFMAGHGYGWVGQVDVAAFALAVGVLVWKSGGLELAVVLHLATNLPLFLLSPLSPTSLQQGDADPRLLLVSLPLTLVTTAALAVWVSRTHGVGLLEPVRGRGRAPAVAPVRAGAVA